VLQRPGLAPPQSRRNAASIGVLATERIEYERIERAIWKAFFTQNRRDYDRWVHLPSRLLTKLDNHYDVCLLDFPAARTGPLTLAGLLASQWWLFPVRPDRMGVRDLDGPYFVMRHLAKSWKHQLRFLSTIPYMCPSTHTNHYADTRKELEAWANDQKIPSLVDRRGWVLYDTKAINALDDTRSFNTLVQRFGSSSHAFYMRIKRLAKEILDTLEIPYAADERDTFAHRLAERFAIA